jgi:hypothetical protein
MSYEEFKQLAEANAQNDQWLFAEGYNLMQQYPEYCDRLVAENLIQSLSKVEAAE